MVAAGVNIPGRKPGSGIFSPLRVLAALKNIFLKANISLGPIFRRVNNIRARRDNKVGCHVTAIAKRGSPGGKKMNRPRGQTLVSFFLAVCLLATRFCAAAFALCRCRSTITSGKNLPRKMGGPAKLISIGISIT